MPLRPGRAATTSSTRDDPGRGGDFITAPELHPIFGATLSGLVLDAWERLGEPDPFTVREIGPGTGALAESLLAALRGTPLGDRLRYAARRGRRPTGSTRSGPGSPRPGSPVPGRARPTATRRRRSSGSCIANEVLDALPVHRVRQRGSDLREVAVDADADGAFLEVEIDPSTPALAARLSDEGVVLADGQTAEICLDLDDWVAGAAAGLERGLLLLSTTAPRPRRCTTRSGGATARSAPTSGTRSTTTRTATSVGRT